MKHKARYVDTYDKNGDPAIIYHKTEVDDHFLFRKTNSVSLNSENLSSCHYVLIDIVHRHVTILASREEILAHDDCRSYGGETKYYYPVDKWQVVEGDLNWTKKLSRFGKSEQ